MKKPIYKQLPARKIVVKNPDHSWLEKNYPGYVHSLFMQGMHAGVFLMNKYFPFGFKTGYMINETTKHGPEMDWFWDARELDRVRGIFLNKNRTSLKHFNAVYRWWETMYRIMEKAYADAEKIDVHSLSDRALYNLYEKLYWANIEQGAAGYLADSFLSTGTDDWLREFIVSRIGQRNDIDAIVAVLTAPTIPSYSQEEHEQLRRLAEPLVGQVRSFTELQKRLARDARLRAALERHAQRFYWVENNYYTKQFSFSDFAARLYGVLRQGSKESLAAVTARNQKNRQAMLRKFNDQWLSNIVDMSSRMTHVQDYRKRALVRFSHFLHLIFCEMAARTGLTEQHFQNLIEPEVADVFLKRRINRKLLEERIAMNFSFGTPSGYVLYEGARVRKFVDLTQFRQSHAGQTQVTGVCACVGHVTGTARVVRNAHEVAVFNKGDILIANQTTPEYVPLMKKASAIVTDQGGITAHAAIISRELNIPCVIGTKIATKVFKDGDRVEVDATKGTVKKLAS